MTHSGVYMKKDAKTKALRGLFAMKTLYLSDLDGTLLHSDEHISEYTVNTVNRFVQAGGYFSYATARSFITASKVTTGLNTDFPVICYNGAFIIRNSTQEIMQSNYFNREVASSIRQVLSERGIFPIIYAYINNKEHFSFIDAHVSHGMRLFLNSRLDDVRLREVKTEDELYSGDLFYFSCISDVTELAPIRDIFEKDDRVNCIYQADIYSGAQWCELLPAQASKANAALALKEELGCDRLVVFGDGSNDLSLFSVADECYAMYNAVPALKNIATAIIGSNDEDGVAKWLEVNVL